MTFGRLGFPALGGRCSRRDWASTIGACLAVAVFLTISKTDGLQAGETRSEADRSSLLLELLFERSLSDTSPGGHRCVSHGKIAFAEGKRSTAAAFDGRTWIDTGLLQKELSDEFTVECWVKPAAQQAIYADIFGNHVADGRGFVVQQDGASTNQFLAAYGAGAGRFVTTAAAPLMPGRWQHIALVRNRAELQFYLNGVLVASQPTAAPSGPSPMPIAVGLGYSGQERCFRGQIDEFRVWNKALTRFEHADIDPILTRETGKLLLETVPRPPAGALAQSWTLATDDTRLTLGVTAAGELVLHQLICPATGRNWIARPVAFELPSEADVGGLRRELRCRFVDAAVQEESGRELTLRFACPDPGLEFVSRWRASPGPGPIEHRMFVANRSSQAVTIGEQPTFDLDMAGASGTWSFHSDGGTPDRVGVYHRPLDGPGIRHSVRTSPNGELIPLVVLETNDRQGMYVGLEWSFCRIDMATLSGVSEPTLRLRAGNFADLRLELPPGETAELRPGFLGAYRGDLDDGSNHLRRWLLRHRVPEVLRQDPTYPKVQWNAFGATGKKPKSWDPVERKYYPFVDAIAPLGFEEVMIDVGWWQGSEPDFDRADWSSGMKRAADYAHAKGLRFGLYWTDNLDMATATGRRQRAARIARLFREYKADMWRSDNTRGTLVGSSFAATRGFYEMVDGLAREIPGFQWENCSSGGRIKDYGAMRRAIKIFNSDTYSTLHVRQAFYDSSYAFHPIQIEGHLGSTDGRFRPRGVAGMNFAFRSTSMGAPEWFIDSPGGGNGSEPWTQAEKDAVKACVETYKTRLRPLVRGADLYHIFPRPDGRRWDGIEYYDPAAAKGVVYLFKPAPTPDAEMVRFKGLDPGRKYRLHFEDGSQADCVRSGAELVEKGLPVALAGAEVSELIFFETGIP